MVEERKWVSMGGYKSDLHPLLPHTSTHPLATNRTRIHCSPTHAHTHLHPVAHGSIVLSPIHISTHLHPVGVASMVLPPIHTPTCLSDPFMVLPPIPIPPHPTPVRDQHPLEERLQRQGLVHCGAEWVDRRVVGEKRSSTQWERVAPESWAGLEPAEEPACACVRGWQKGQGRGQPQGQGQVRPGAKGPRASVRQVSRLQHNSSAVENASEGLVPMQPIPELVVTIQFEMQWKCECRNSVPMQPTPRK